jgi:beta-N-acetylhexosaminidase
VQRQRTGARATPRRPVVPAVLAATLGASFALTACAGGSPSTSDARTISASSSTGDRASATAAPSVSEATPASPSTLPPPASASASASASACATTTLAALTDAQRVGQLFLVGIPVDDPDARPAAVATAAALSAGGYLIYGRSDAGVSATRQLTDDVSARLAHRSAGVAPFVAVDQEGGQIQTLSGPGFSSIPSALQQGSMPVARLREVARTWGEQLRRAGVNVDLAPVLDVVPTDLGRANQPIGRYDRELGHTPDVVATHGVAVIEGLRLAGVAPTAKHFPGLGRVSGNPDVQTGVTDGVTTASDPALQPFAAAVAADVPIVMMSTAVYTEIDPDGPAAFSPVAIGLLRNGLHFGGLIAADDLGQAAQVRQVPAGTRALRFLAAGGQVIVVVKPAAAAGTMSNAVVTAMTADPSVRDQVETAALQVLATKARLGLLPCR